MLPLQCSVSREAIEDRTLIGQLNDSIITATCLSVTNEYTAERSDTLGWLVVLEDPFYSRIRANESISVDICQPRHAQL